MESRKDNQNQNNNLSIAEAEVTAPEPGIVARSIHALKQVFYSLKHANFRILWIGGWFSNVGTWIQNVALGWLVYKLTGSSVSLGVVNFSATIPVFFLSFYAGTVADRLPKKWLIFWGNFFPMVFAFILGMLVSINKITMLWLILLSLGTGIATAFAFPAWQSFLSEIVPRKDLMNAIALNSVQFHASRLVGPAIAGFLVSELGLDWAFFINAISFLAVLFAVMLVKTPEHKKKESRGWVKEVIESFVYLRQKPSLIYLMTIVALIGVFGISYLGTLMPIFAGDILKVKAKEFGALMAVNGFGGLLGALFVAWVAGKVSAERILKYSVPLSGLALIFLTINPGYVSSLVFLFIAGAAFLASNSTLNTVVQSSVDHTYRGRIMSIFVWMFMGIAPFGSLIAGFLGKVIGIKLTIALGGFLVLSMGLLMLYLAEKKE